MSILLALVVALQVKPRGGFPNAKDQSPPIPLRTLTKQEIVHKMDQVPVFALVDKNKHLIPSRHHGQEDDAPRPIFYLDLHEAKAQLESLVKANHRNSVQISVTPLGTAFALAEWQRPVSEPDENDVDSATGPLRNLRYARAGFQRSSETGALRESSGETIDLRIQACRRELAAANDALSQTPAPPLLQRRDRIQGPIPVFGSDELRFQASTEEGDAKNLFPLFFHREDFRDAWVSSGGSVDNLPTVQVSDLRTLAWQMETDATMDWSCILFVAPQTSIDYIVEEQRDLISADLNAQPVASSRAEVQRGLFPM